MTDDTIFASCVSIYATQLISWRVRRWLLVVWASQRERRARASVHTTVRQTSSSGFEYLLSVCVCLGQTWFWSFVVVCRIWGWWWLAAATRQSDDCQKAFLSAGDWRAVFWLFWFIHLGVALWQLGDMQIFLCIYVKICIVCVCSFSI